MDGIMTALGISLPTIIFSYNLGMTHFKKIPELLKYGSLSSNILRIKSNVAGRSVQKNTGEIAFCAVTND
jgi:hypothetical protein